MNHDSQQVIKSSVFYTSALIYQKILSFVYFSVIARSLGPEKLGAYLFALSFSSFFQIVADFGFVSMAIRTFSQDDDKHQERHFQTFFTIRIGLAVIAVFLLNFTAYLLGYDSELKTMIIITSIIMIADAFTAFFYTVFRSRQNLLYESIGTVIFQTIVMVFGMLALKFTNNIKTLLLVILCASAFHIIFSFYLLAKKTNIKIKLYFHQDVAAKWMRRAFQFFLATGFIKAYNTIDTILLKNMASDKDVGLYSIPAKVVFTFPFLALAMTASIYPAMSNYAKNSPEKLQSVFTKSLIVFAAISLPIALGINLLAQDIIDKIWPEFTESAQGLKILIWAVFFLYIEYPIGSLLNATSNEKKNTINRGIQLLFFLAINIALIPKIGFMGSVYASLFSSVLIVVLGIKCVSKIVKVLEKNFLQAFIKLSLASAIMAISVLWLKQEYHFLVVIPVAATVYAFSVFAFKVFKKEDFNLFASVFR